MMHTTGKIWYKLSLQAFALVFFLAPLITSSQAVDSLIVKANQQYSEGRYEEAADNYREALERGYTSWELYYNLGNTSFKLGNIPEAILFYEKAHKLSPGNEDVEYNLGLARSRTTDKIEPVPELFLRAWWRVLREQLTVDQWAWVSVAGFFIVLVLAGFVFLSRSQGVKRTSFWTGVVFLVITLISVSLASQSYREIVVEDEAIIFTPTVTVKSSPNKGSVDLFVIHEGTKVHITDKVEGWSEIRIADGSKGWVRDDTYRTI